MRVKVSYILIIKEQIEIDVEDLEMVEDSIIESKRSIHGENFVECIPYKVEENGDSYKKQVKTWFKIEV